MSYNQTMEKITVGINESGMRLDRFLKKYLVNSSLSYIYRAIRKDVKVNGKRSKEDYILLTGDEITLYIPDDELAHLTEKKETHHTGRNELRIVYEDDNILVADKPQGLLTHGDMAEQRNTLVNQVTDHLIATGEYVPRAEKTFRPAPCNRLDRNTGGLVVFGKNALSLRKVNKLFQSRRNISKYYLVVVAGRIDEETVITGGIDKDEKTNRVRVADSGRASESIVRPVAPADDYSVVEVELVTGRPHQIRAHLASIGHPVVGDPKYGDPAVNQRAGADRQLLHAYRLVFGNVEGGLEYLSNMEITGEIPEEINRYARGVGIE